MAYQFELPPNDCHCPVGKDTAKRFPILEYFHKAAEEITDAILFDIEDPKEI